MEFKKGDLIILSEEGRKVFPNLPPFEICKVAGYCMDNRCIRVKLPSRVSITSWSKDFWVKAGGGDYSI